MELRKKQLFIYAKPDENLDGNIKHQKNLGWKFIKQTFTPNKFLDGRGEFILEFEEILPEPDNDEYYDEFAGEEYFEYDGDTKTAFWHGQRIN